MFGILGKWACHFALLGMEAVANVHFETTRPLILTRFELDRIREHLRLFELWWAAYDGKGGLGPLGGGLEFDRSGTNDSGRDGGRSKVSVTQSNTASTQGY